MQQVFIQLVDTRRCYDGCPGHNSCLLAVYTLIGEATMVMLGTVMFVMTVGDQEQNPCLFSPLYMTLQASQKDSH